MRKIRVPSSYLALFLMKKPDFAEGNNGKQMRNGMADEGVKHFTNMEWTQTHKCFGCETHGWYTFWTQTHKFLK